tara:strand:- start:311 stop:538 length:228 start_codon:yes stop_codon:yes gene_type:complete
MSIDKDNLSKSVQALRNLKSGVEFYYHGDKIETEEDFNNINWKTGEDENGMFIGTKNCPHSEITWAKFKEEYDKL